MQLVQARREATVMVAASSHVTTRMLHRARKEVAEEATRAGITLLLIQGLRGKEAPVLHRDVAMAMVAVRQEEAVTTPMQNTVQRNAWHTKRLQ